MFLKVKIWDVEHGAQEKLSIPGHEGFVTSMTWNEEASLMATTAKDKMLRIIDPRAKSIVSVKILLIDLLFGKIKFLNFVGGYLS